MGKLIRNAERRIVSAFEFWQNFFYYLDKGYRPRKAWELAGYTLP